VLGSPQTGNGSLKGGAVGKGVQRNAGPAPRLATANSNAKHFSLHTMMASEDTDDYKSPAFRLSLARENAKERNDVVQKPNRVTGCRAVDFRPAVDTEAGFNRCIGILPSCTHSIETGEAPNAAGGDSSAAQGRLFRIPDARERAF